MGQAQRKSIDSSLHRKLYQARTQYQLPSCFIHFLEKNALRPGLKITELIKTELKNNTDETPLLVKITPASQDQITAKTIYIRDTDDDGELKDEYIKYNVKNNENLRDIYKNGMISIKMAKDLSNYPTQQLP